MDRARRDRGVVEAGWRARRVHSIRLLVEHGSHLAIVLILCIAAAPAFAQSDIKFDPAITQSEFATFSRLIAQGIFADPVQPARANGLLGFDVGIAVTGVKVDTKSTYWQRAVPATSDFTHGGYAGIPRLVVSKGFGGGTVALTYAQISSSGIKTYGGSIDLPIIRGSVMTPELGVRASYSTLTGVDVFKLKTYGLEAFLSKGFGPVMPFAAVGKMRSDARGMIPPPGPTFAPASTMILTDSGDVTRWSAGVRLSLLVPKLVVEATKAQVTSYSAKISIGF